MEGQFWQSKMSGKNPKEDHEAPDQLKYHLSTLIASSILSNSSWGSHFPCTITPFKFIRWLRSSKGFPSKSNKSARFPVSIVPNSCSIPKNLAGFTVADHNISIGDNPLSSRNCISWCRDRPGIIRGEGISFLCFPKFFTISLILHPITCWEKDITSKTVRSMI